MRRRLIGALTLALLAQPVPGQENRPAPSGLPESPALSTRLILTAEGIPIGDLLSLVRKRTGVPLSAEPELAAEKVIVFGPVRPLREVLADLATLINARWEVGKTGEGGDRYVLARSRKSQEYQAGL